jgi:hypothetical protein
MNVPFNTTPTFALPAELDSLSPPPLLLPGESLENTSRCVTQYSPILHRAP